VGDPIRQTAIRFGCLIRKRVTLFAARKKKNKEWYGKLFKSIYREEKNEKSIIYYSMFGQL